MSHEQGGAGHGKPEKLTRHQLGFTTKFKQMVRMVGSVYKQRKVLSRRKMVWGALDSGEDPEGDLGLVPVLYSLLVPVQDEDHGAAEPQHEHHANSPRNHHIC